MRGFVLTLAAGMLSASGAIASEPLIFHSAHFADDTIVNLGLISNRMATLGGYDYDVLISLSKIQIKNGAVYSDPGRHRALVKCSDPAKVSVRGVDYPVRASDPESGSDWKADLWRAVCLVPVS